MLRLLYRPLFRSTTTTLVRPRPIIPLARTMATANTPDFVRPSLFFEKTDNSRVFLFQNRVLYKPLEEIDPEVKNIIDKETWRQFTGLELIASEVCKSSVSIVFSSVDVNSRLLFYFNYRT